MFVELLTIWGILLAALMFGHWVGDFVCQTQWMAENKSKNWKALLSHVGVYSVVMTLVGLVLPLAFLTLTPTWDMAWDMAIPILYFFLGNAVLHCIIDAVTSRWTSYFMSQGNRSAFFIMIGFDQWLHFVCLLGSLTLMFCV